jgi:hypothetical protein
MNAEVFTLLKKKPVQHRSILWMKPKHIVALIGAFCGTAFLRQIVLPSFDQIRIRKERHPCQDVRFLNLDQLTFCTTTIPYNATEKDEILRHLRLIVSLF